MPDIFINLFDVVGVNFRCIHITLLYPLVCNHLQLSYFWIVLLFSGTEMCYTICQLNSHNNPTTICQPRIPCPTLVPSAWCALSHS